MSEDVASQAIDLVAQQSQGRMGVQFFGGEPLLEYDLLVYCVEYAQNRARQAGLACVFRATTNGSLLTDEACRFFRDIGLVLTISSEGLPQRQDACRRFADGRPSSAVVEAAVQRALAHNVRVKAYMVLDPCHLENFVESVAYLRRCGVRMFSLGLNIFVRWTEAQIRQVEQTIEGLGRLYLQSILADQPLGIDVLDDKLFAWAVGGYPGGQTCPSCRWLLSVTPDGRLFRGRAFTSDCRGCSDSVGDVWQGLRISLDGHALKSGEPLSPRCKSCGLAPYCMYWCRCANTYTSGNPDVPGEVLCRYQAAVIRTAERVSHRITGELAQQPQADE